MFLLLIVACGEPVEEVPQEVYDLREVGVNVLGIDKAYTEMVVLYEPLGDEEQMIWDVGIIAGYMYQSNTFDKLKIVVEVEAEEIFSILIDHDDFEDYSSGEIDAAEFRERWEFI